MTNILIDNNESLGVTAMAASSNNTFIQAIINFSLPIFYLLFPAVIIPIVLIRVIYFIVAIISGGNDPLYYKKGHPGFSSTSSSDVEYWIYRCSICFDKNQEFCLNRCRDQFCRDCFNRYVKEVVNNSWGLSVTKIKCPVCQDHLPISEWSRQVDPEIVKLYNQYNQPYRSLDRCCGECGEVAYTAKVEVQLNGSARKKYMDDLEVECSTMLQCAESSQSKITSFLACLKFDYNYFVKGGLSGGTEIYCKTIERMMQIVLSGSSDRSFEKEMRSRAASISSKLIAIELKPEIWKELQFEHIARFPHTNCSKCYNPVCLLCGLSDHHNGVSCLDYMRNILEAGDESEEKLQTLRWTLTNSKSCPHCRILINRDDGCNKVDCLYCGFRFCWICLSAWSEKCGFYQCQSLPIGNSDSQPISDKPELGIPDVMSIEAKLKAN